MRDASPPAASKLLYKYTHNRKHIMTHMQSKHTSCYYIRVNGNGKTLKQLALLRLTAGNAKETELLNEHTCTKTRFSLVVFCMLVLLIHDTQHEATCEIHLSVLCNIQFNNRESSSFLLLQDFLKTGFIVMFQIKLLYMHLCPKKG